MENNCDDLVEFADDSLGSDDQDGFTLNTATDTICLNDNLEKSGERSAKNRKKKSKYEDYPVLPTDVIPINLPFSTRKIFR